ncbi:hypothetical protein ACJX0J_012492, partial [Zea mays]
FIGDEKFQLSELVKTRGKQIKKGDAILDKKEIQSWTSHNMGSGTLDALERFITAQSKTQLLFG